MSVLSHIVADKFRRNRVGLGKALVWFGLGALFGTAVTSCLLI